CRGPQLEPSRRERLAAVAGEPDEPPAHDEAVPFQPAQSRVEKPAWSGARELPLVGGAARNCGEDDGGDGLGLHRAGVAASAAAGEMCDGQGVSEGASTTLPRGSQDDFGRIASWDEARAESWVEALDLRAAGADQTRLREEILALAKPGAGDTAV